MKNQTEMWNKYGKVKLTYVVQVWIYLSFKTFQTRLIFICNCFKCTITWNKCNKKSNWFKKFYAKDKFKSQPIHLWYWNYWSANIIEVYWGYTLFVDSAFLLRNPVQPVLKKPWNSAVQKHTYHFFLTSRVNKW